MSEPTHGVELAEILTRFRTTTDLPNLLRLLRPREMRGLATAPPGLPFGGPAPTIIAPDHDAKFPSTGGSRTVYIGNAAPNIRHEVLLLSSSGMPMGGPPPLTPSGTSFNVNVTLQANGSANPMIYFLEVGFNLDPMNPNASENGEHQRHRIKIIVLAPLTVGTPTGNPIPTAGQHSPLPVSLSAMAQGGAGPYTYVFKDTYNGTITTLDTVTGVAAGTVGQVNTTLTGTATPHDVKVTVTDAIGTEFTSSAPLTYTLV